MNQFLFSTTWFLPLYGLIGALLTLPWAIGLIKRTGPRPAAYLNLLTTGLAFFHSLFLFKEIWKGEPESFAIDWFCAADLNLSFALNIFSKCWCNAFTRRIEFSGTNLCPRLPRKRLGDGKIFCFNGLF